MDYVKSEDRISDLPWKILDNILGRLPIKTTVSTTILSTKWRDKWVNLSKLVFDDFSIPPHSNPDTLSWIVNSVLLSHRGTVERFIFTPHSSYYKVDMDTWISLLRKRGVNELTCEFSNDYTLPPHFFSLDVLKHLSLTNCWSEIPHKFTAFKGLVSLELKQFKAASVIQAVINNSPILEKLVLSEICFDFLYTYVPKLKYFHVEGEFKGVDLQNSPHLTDACFKMTTEAADTPQQLSCVRVQLPGWFSLIRKMALSGYFLRDLAARCIWRGVNIACDKLEVIELDGLHFDHLEEMSLAFSVLVCSTDLQELRIRGSGPVNKEFNKFAEGLAQVISCRFNQLRVVKIEITRYERDQIEGPFLGMVKLILSRSPLLEKMDIHYIHSETSDLWFMNELLQSERASSQLRLEYTSTRVPYGVPLPQQAPSVAHDDVYAPFVAHDDVFVFFGSAKKNKKSLIKR